MLISHEPARHFPKLEAVTFVPDLHLKLLQYFGTSYFPPDIQNLCKTFPLPPVKETLQPQALYPQPPTVQVRLHPN